MSIRSKAGAVVHRLLPRSRTWTNIGDFITFRGRGFVAAGNPETLLARHNYEIAEIRRRLPGKHNRSLEIGCGFGRLTPHFAASSALHTAIDINPQALAIARRHYPHFDFREGSATDLPFPDATFDLITTWTVLQHLPPNRVDEAIREIGRVATPLATILLCEESVLSDTPQLERWDTHTWHRKPGFYVDRLEGFALVAAQDIVDLTRIGIATPGTVILLQGTSPRGDED